MRRLPLFLLAAVGCDNPASTPPPPPAWARTDPSQQVESPDYTRWAKADPGTAVVYDVVTDEAGTVSCGGCSYRLVGRVKGTAEVEARGWVKTPDGRKAGTYGVTHTYYRWTLKSSVPAGDPARPAGAHADGTEAITVRGKKYATRWYKTKDLGETETQTWYSDDVPGWLVRSVLHDPAVNKTVTTQLAEVQLP